MSSNGKRARFQIVELAMLCPIELMVSVIEALENGARITKVSKLFRVSRDTIYKWKILQDKHGSLKAASGYQKGHSHKIKNLEDFKEFFELNIDIVHPPKVWILVFEMPCYNFILCVLLLSSWYLCQFIVIFYGRMRKMSAKRSKCCVLSMRPLLPLCSI